MMILSFFFCHSLLLLTDLCPPAEAEAVNGHWELLQTNVGISAMHMQLLNNDRVIIFDRTDFGPSNLSLPDGKCLRDPDAPIKLDCTAHSIEYNVANNAFRPLTLQSDTWCSAGAVIPDGTLVQSEGSNSGERRVRSFKPCPTCDWLETHSALLAPRWYATNHILPYGRQILIGGINQFNYEFYPKTKTTQKLFHLPFLSETFDKPNLQNNLHPFVFLNKDGNLFIFANNRAILFDFVNNRAVKKFPMIPGGDPRSYPSTGSAVLLPLNLQDKVINVEVLVCGGAPKEAYTKAIDGIFVEALTTCARMKINDQNPQWVLETMPHPRVMADMLLLPDGNVLLINGGSAGVAGWDLGREPILNPVIYHTKNELGMRFELQNPSTIPRMYHSSAIVLRDGRVLVGGSNPHEKYNFKAGVLFPTELRLEAFHPFYLDSKFSDLRPKITSPVNQSKLLHGETFRVGFRVGRVDPKLLNVTMLSPSFNTHSFSMNQRLLILARGEVIDCGNGMFEVEVSIPVSGKIAPLGYYILYVVNLLIPSEGIWVQINRR